MIANERFSWTRAAARLVFAAIVVGIFVVYGSFFIVSEGNAAVVTRFGKPVREIAEPGLYWKWPPPVERLETIDRRRNSFTTPDAAAFTRDKKSVVLSALVVWHVERPLAYLQSVRDAETAQSLLTAMILSAKNQQFGRHEFSALVSLDRKTLALNAMEEEIRRDVHASALEKLGIAVDAVGIERIAYPEENLPAVYERMRAERTAEANRLRSEGMRAAQAIRDDGYIKGQEILRQGKDEAARITAEAEFQASTTLAGAHKKDPEFYQFWSGLQTARRALRERSTLILRSDQTVFEPLFRAKPALAPPNVERDRAPAQEAVGKSEDRSKP